MAASEMLLLLPRLYWFGIHLPKKANEESQLTWVVYLSPRYQLKTVIRERY